MSTRKDKRSSGLTPQNGSQKLPGQGASILMKKSGVVIIFGIPGYSAAIVAGGAVVGDYSGLGAIAMAIAAIGIVLARFLLRNSN